MQTVLGEETGVIGARGEKGEVGIERKVGLKGVGCMRRLLRGCVCDILARKGMQFAPLQVTFSNWYSVNTCMPFPTVSSAFFKYEQSPALLSN
jgi:hypothetical protein